MPCISIMGGAEGGAVARVSTMPMPSIMACGRRGLSTSREHEKGSNTSQGLASRMPPASADLAADAGPVLRDRKPPVSAPALIEFQGSSCRQPELELRC